MPSTHVQPCALDARRRQILLDDIVAFWQQGFSWTKPSAMWVLEYPVLPGDYDGEVGMEDYGLPCAAWFLDANGLRSKSVWDYGWFYIFQFVQPWSSLATPRLEPPLWNQHRHEIGLASFTPLENSELIYLETVYGGTTGGADLVSINRQGNIETVRPLMRY